MGETAISVESISTEYLRLFDEGWNPNIDEFLSRVPEEMREECRQRIEELAALNGLDLSQVGGPAAAAPPATDAGALAQITPDGDDASGSAPRLRRAGSVLDEMSALAAQEQKKPGRRRPKRAPEPPPEPASVHEGIEALSAIESVEVPEIQAEPELAEQPPEQVELTEHTETQLVEVDPGGQAPDEAPRTRPGRSRDEPVYAAPAQAVARREPPKPKAPPRAPARVAPVISAEAQRDALARLREVTQLERQGAIPAVESDRLAVIYRRLLDMDGAAQDLPVTLPHLALYAFVAAAVAGAGLFVALVHDASPVLQALVPGAIFLTLLGAGVRARAQGDGAGSALFLAASAVASAPAIVAGLAVLGVLGGESVLPAPLSDLRLLAGTGGGLFLSAACLLVLRRGLFSWVTAIYAAAAWGAFVVSLGVHGLAAHDIALRFLPLVLLSVPGLLLESQGKVRWAMPFHLVALGALLGALDVLALHGGLLELLGLSTMAGPARLPYLGFAVAGLVLAVLSLALERARSFDLRRAARFLQLLSGIHLIGALGLSAAVNGAGKDVIALGAASAMLLVLGRFQRRSLLAAGGIGLVLALCLAVIGGAAAPGSFALGLSGAGLLGSLGIYFYLGRRGA